MNIQMENRFIREYRQLNRIKQIDEVPFEAALKEGDIQIVKEYSKRYANITFEKGYKPIHIVCEKGHIDIVQLLIDQSCDVNCETAMKERPIHLAVKNGHISVVQKLIKHQCDIECETEQKWRPIHISCLNGHTDIVKLLLEQHCNIECETKQKWRPIHISCLNGHTDFVKLLLEQHCNIECETQQKMKPIHIACTKGHTDIVKLLIEHPCDIECETEQMMRPIHFASREGHADIVELLIKKNCNIESTNINGRRPIHLACQRGHINIVNLLIKNNCETKCVDEDNKTPFDFANIHGRIEIVDLLHEKAEDDQLKNNRTKVLSDDELYEKDPNGFLKERYCKLKEIFDKCKIQAIEKDEVTYFMNYVQRFFNFYNRKMKSSTLRNLSDNKSFEEEVKLGMNCLCVSISIINVTMTEIGENIVLELFDYLSTFSEYSRSSAVSRRMTESILYCLCNYCYCTNDDGKRPLDLANNHHQCLQNCFTHPQSEKIKLASAIIICFFNLTDDQMYYDPKRYLKSIIDVCGQSYLGIKNKLILGAIYRKMKSIHLACADGDIDQVKLLIQKKCDFECEAEHNLRPIHIACMKGLLDATPILINQDCNKDCEVLKKFRPIPIACMNGHFDIVRLLIEQHCEIECETERKFRPIHFACMNGHVDIVRLLIEQHCNIEYETERKFRPIHIACMNGNIDIIRLLLEQHCNIDCEAEQKLRPIHFACMNGHVDIIRLLMEQHCDIECEAEQKLRPIHFACMNGHVDVIRLLMEQHCDIECEAEKKIRPIYIACANGHIDVARLLIDQGCDIECEAEQVLITKYEIFIHHDSKTRPIHTACANGHIDIVRLLIEQDCDITCETYEGRTPINLACVNGHDDIVDLISATIRDGKLEGKRDFIADRMGLTCGKSCNHSGFCRESFIQQSDYIKKNKIGSGSFGAVYRLRDSATDRHFAMKFIPYDIEEDKFKNIEHYINICLEDLQHENIVKFYGSVTEMSNNCLWNEQQIFMEYMEGGSLHDYINKNKRIPHDKVIWFTKQILEGVSFLHLHRIVHRNIKPDNILLDGKEKLKLAGFSLSRFLKCSNSFHKEAPKLFMPFLKEYRKESVSSMLVDFLDSGSNIFSFATMNNDTEVITIHPCYDWVGTIGYIAPEIRHNKPYRLEVDIWSVGATMFHMLTRIRPHFNKKNFRINKRGFVYDLMYKMIKENPSDRPTANLLLQKIEIERQTNSNY